ncbi:MAG: hypothetical protein WKF73_11210, partial [Nocardioidaceae bacterium]
ATTGEWQARTTSVNRSHIACCRRLLRPAISCVAVQRWPGATRSRRLRSQQVSEIDIDLKLAGVCPQEG